MGCVEKPADYQVVGSYRSPAELTRLHCRLETGRTHQIRVHMAHLGHPLLGDTKFGRRPRGSGRDPLPRASRCLLHAERLAFPHPGFTSA